MPGRFSTIKLPARKASNRIPLTKKTVDIVYAASEQPTFRGGSVEVNVVSSSGNLNREGAENSASGIIELLMAAYLKQPGTGSFSLLSKALLIKLQDDARDFTASVSLPGGVGVYNKNVQTIVVALDLISQSGVKISLSLAQQQDGLATRMKITGGLLTADDMKAVAALAAGFQATLNGVFSPTAFIDINGLLDINRLMLWTVDLDIEIRQGETLLRSISFYGARTQRALNYRDNKATFVLNTDMSQAQLMGAQAQQTKALAAFENQLNSALSCGHGDASLFNLFISAFLSLNSHYGANGVNDEQHLLPPSETTNSQAYLCGLADFNASFQQTEFACNPSRQDEKQSFTYVITQKTSGWLDNNASGEITQQTAACLQASFDASLHLGNPLPLTKLPSCRNYNYQQIEDKTRESATLEFEKGYLAAVTLFQTTHYSESVAKYLDGQFAGKTETPYDNAMTRQVKLMADGWLWTVI